MQEAAYLLLRIEFGTLLLEPANADHLLQQVLAMHACQPRMRYLGFTGTHAKASSVDVSPSGSPSSRAFSRRRMILLLRVLGRLSAMAMMRGATAAPSRLRACAMISLSSSALASWPRCSVTKALTISPARSSGTPIAAASATEGCSTRALSASKGPMKCPDDLIMSSARPTNQK